MSIYRTAVQKPVTTILVFVAFVVFGIYSLINTSIAQFPDFDANVVMVMSSYPGASASDVENNLTKLLENALNGVEHLKDMTSRSRENIGIVILEFEYGTDINNACNDVRDKLDMVSMTLPDGASQPYLMKFSLDDMPVMILSATADESFNGLDRILDDRVTTPLARVNGVGTVNVVGAPTREIQVYCDPNKLAGYGLSIAGIAGAISYENRNVPSGSIDIGTETYSLRVEKEFKDPVEILDVVVGYSGGNAIYLRDVATLVDGPAEKYQQSFTGGVQSAAITIQKQTGSNTVNVIRDVKKKIAEIEPNLPPDIHISTVIDSSDNIINTINSLLKTILITLLVVMFVVFIFLGRWRATFIIVLAIPIALMGSLIYLLATHNTLNIISMSALSIAIGMVVDNSIVVLENISKHIERGENTKEAAVNGTSEVSGSIIGSTLTTLCVFLPLTMVSGMAGIMFTQLGWIVSIIMIVSTAMALTLVPVMCSRMLKAGPKNGRLHRMIFDPIEKALSAFSEWYSKVVRWCITHRKTVTLSAFALIVAVVALLAPQIKTGFFPNSDQGRLSVTVELPVGTGQEVTGEFAARLYQRFASEIPEIKVFQYRYGQADSDNSFANMMNNGSYLISMNINLGSMEDRDRSTSDIANIIRAELAEYPEIKRAMVSEGMGGVGGATTVALEIYGYDFDETDRIAKEIQEKMLDSGDFVQVTLSRDEYTPEYQVDFDREKLAINGLSSTTAASAFSAAMSGSVMSYFREEGDEYNIRVRYSKDYRSSVADIENTIIYTATGKAVRIKELGSVVETKVPPTIERKNRERYITVTGITAKGVAMSDGVRSVQDVVKTVNIPNDITTEMSGDFEDQQEMFTDLGVLLLLIFLLVYMVMAAQFENFVSPFVIMFSIPFGFMGVLLGLWATGTQLDVISMVGLLILVGIVVNNGIVLIDYINLMRERGMSVIEAAVTSARSRLRPILMTTLTTVIGMLPLALGRGEGSETWRGLGMSVAWGLTFSTIVTLVLIPTIYCIFATRQERRQSRKHKFIVK
ncbi:MAG: efflux RND transporter permease subunit [Bacteroidales bacterium]|nr:efflux RND transporter permease subunit [Bacteroidales bacterium]MBQ5944044.1 efflux RND transporter permease subunit [Bacteroidales bacterium]